MADDDSSQEKTEEASEQKLKKSRDDGQVTDGDVREQACAYRSCSPAARPQRSFERSSRK